MTLLAIVKRESQLRYCGSPRVEAVRKLVNNRDEITHIIVFIVTTDSIRVHDKPAPVEGIRRAL